ncbi:Crp/Fnr family transcriptional regulator [Saccharopolyspora gregorii]|uniref:Crp/Fnr family transcriptional regulator n=1 Tax=Saccharopolyspora gregorii TaxID=33914 RepID=A0ABP6RTD2_9PSEU
MGILVGFRRGEPLMSVGDPANHVVLIERGLIKIVLPDPQGGQPVAGIFGPGDLLGEMGAIYGRNRSATAIAVSDGHAWRVRAPIFRSMQAHAEPVRDLINDTWWKRQENFDRRQLAQSRDVSTRIAMALSQWADRFGKVVESGLKVEGLTQRDIAGVVGASAKHVEAGLRRLRSAELIRTGRRSFTVLDPTGLSDVAQGCWPGESPFR